MAQPVYGNWPKSGTSNVSQHTDAIGCHCNQRTLAEYEGGRTGHFQPCLNKKTPMWRAGATDLLARLCILRLHSAATMILGGEAMYSKLIGGISALALGLALSLGAFGQSAAQENSAAEKRHESITDETVKNYAKHEPHMAAALQHLRQAEEELEKTSNNHGPYRDQAMDLTKQAESKIMYGMQYYDQHVSPLAPPKK